MQSFKYLCIDDQGHRREGSLRAGDQRSAQRELNERGWTVLKLGEEEFLGDGSPGGERGLSAEERQRFLLKLSILMESGVPIVGALEGAAREEPSHFKDWVESVCRQVEAGSPLSESIRAYWGGFMESELALIKLGERTGSLVRVLRRLAEQGRRSLEREQELKSKLTYPFVQVVVLGAICVLLGAYLGPQLNGLIKGLGVEEPALTRWVTTLLSGKVMWPLVTVTGALIALVGLSWSTPAGRQIRGQLLDSVPLLRGLRHEIVVSRFCRMLAQLLDCGFDWQRSLRLCRTGSEEFDDGTERFRKTLMESDFEEAVQSSTTLTSLLKGLLLVGYEAQKIPQLLELYANMLEESIDRRVDTILTLLEPLLMLVMGGTVGVVVIASFLPVMQLVKQL